jgi:5'-nucleotidase
VKVAHQSTAGLEDLYHRTDGAGGKTLYQLGGSYRFAQDDENSDAICLADGYITITPLKVDMTDHARLSRMAGETWKTPPIQ